MPCGCAVFTPSRNGADVINSGVSLFGGAPRLFFRLLLLVGVLGGALDGRDAAAAPATTWATPAPDTSVATPAPDTSVATPAPDTSVATPNPDTSVANPSPATPWAVSTPAATRAAAGEAQDEPTDGAVTGVSIVPPSRDEDAAQERREPAAAAIKRPWLQASISMVLLLSTYLLFTLRTR